MNLNTPQSISMKRNCLGELVGTSQRMQELYDLICAAAPTQATLLLTGESGSGKEAMARTLYRLSGRTGPLVVFDASVADRQMIRDDLFGHVKGAFTGASHGREGAFRRARGGTLFIDEIGELPLELQPYLLRALENREIIPVGSDQPVPIDTRLIAATHRDLPAMVQVGRFRADLLHRLSVIQIKAPALREIREDIPLLVQHLLEKLSLRCHVTAKAMEALQRYHWPGNTRELRNVLERAAVFCLGGEIQPEHLNLPEDITTHVDATVISAHPASLSCLSLKSLEHQLIQNALANNRHNIEKAAHELGISISTLRRKLKVLKQRGNHTSLKLS